MMDDIDDSIKFGMGFSGTNAKMAISSSSYCSTDDIELDDGSDEDSWLMDQCYQILALIEMELVAE